MNAKPNVKIAAGEVRQQVYVKHWDTDLKSAIGAAPGYCCFALWCSCCSSYMLRKRTLYNDMSRYLCCGGYLPCSGRCGEQKCPEFCLGMEVVCCFGQSVASTRWMIQDEMQLQNTKCDNCMIATMVALQYISCIFSCIAMCVGSEELRNAAYILDLIADLVWVSVCACMQTQHKVQLDARDKNPGLVMPNNPYMAPVMQQMGVPGPPAGYPVPSGPPQGGAPAYGAPPPQQPPPAYGKGGTAGYPPPQQGGYGGSYPPPQAYPPPPAGYGQPSGYPPQGGRY